jgi:carbamoylphosphate synthase large subunit
MKILITGAGSVMGQSIYRALALHPFRRPVQVHMANSDEMGAALYMKESRLPIVRRVILPLAREASYADIVLDYIQTNGIDIVFSGTQHELSKISQLSNQGICAATLQPEITDLLMDKERTMSLLSSRNVRVPRTQMFSDFWDNPSFQGPGIIKPNTSSASRNLFVFQTRQQIPPQALFTYRDDAYIVQQWLDGDEFTCGCYVDRYSKELSTICMRRSLTADGATGFGEIVHDPDIEQYVRSVAHTLEPDGFHFGHINVQLIVDKEGPCLFEINGRLSSTEAPKAVFGFNSSAAYAVNLVDKSAYDRFSVPQSGKFLRYYEEVFWS